MYFSRDRKSNEIDEKIQKIRMQLHASKEGSSSTVYENFNQLSQKSKPPKVCLLYASGQNLERLAERQEFPPHGPLMIANIFRQIGFDVQVRMIHGVIDNHDSNIFHPMKEFDDLDDFDIIAISVLSSITYPILRRTLTHVPHQKALWMIGGFHATLYPEDTLRELGGDLLISGDGIKIIRDLFGFSTCIEQICNKSQHSFDDMPFPAYNLIPKSYFLLSERVPVLDEANKPNGYAKKTISLISAIGCPYHCYFCASKPEKVRRRSTLEIRSYLQQMQTTYEIDSFVLSDETFTLDPKYVMDFCNAIKDLHLVWSCTTRVDRISREILQEMRIAGCTEIKFGMESGDPTLLQHMNKNVTVSQMEQAAQMTWSSGILVKVLLIHGLPGENQNTTNATISLLEKIRPWIHRVTLFEFVPLPGSEIYIHPELYQLNSFSGNALPSIHQNDCHWWGSNKDYQEMMQARCELKHYLAQNFENNAKLERNKVSTVPIKSN